MNKDVTLKQAALEYAACGFSIIPLVRHGSNVDSAFSHMYRGVFD